MKNIASFLLVVLFSATSSAGNWMCRNLFGDDEIKKTVHALAQLKLQLDLHQGNGGNSLSNAVLNRQYSTKKMELLSYFAKNNLLTETELKAEIAAEIEKLQKASEKAERSPPQKIDLRDFITDGSIAVFLPINIASANKPIQIMQTPLSQILWRKIAGLIKVKTDTGFDFDNFDDLHPQKRDLSPVANVSYLMVMEWVNGLNKLSQMHNSEIKDILTNHEDGDQYRLPTPEEWKTIAMEARVKIPDSGMKSDYTPYPHEDVDTKLPLFIQGMSIFGLGGWDLYTMLRSPDTPTSASIKVPLLETYIRRVPGDFVVAHNSGVVDTSFKGYGLTFRLVRETRTP